MTLDRALITQVPAARHNACSHHTQLTIPHTTAAATTIITTTITHPQQDGCLLQPRRLECVAVLQHARLLGCGPQLVFQPLHLRPTQQHRAANSWATLTGWGWARCAGCALASQGCFAVDAIFMRYV